MKNPSGLWWTIVAGGLLILALTIQLWPAASGTAASTVVKARRIEAVLPVRLGSGSARDEPIATTEEMKKAVGELLNFNDGVYRIYQLPDARVSVYIAWWEAGRMSPRLVASHTPDVCWPGNGWVRDVRAEGELRALREGLRATGFVEGECRVFVANSRPEYVIFWHKVGDNILSYKNGWAPPWWAWLDEMWRGGLNLRKEQLFVRISSDQPLETIWARPEMEPLREALLNLGLKTKGEGQGAKK